MENNKEQIKPQTQWEEKWLREMWTMPFGTIMNSFAIANQGTKISIQDWEKIIDFAFKKANDLTKKSLVDSQISKEEDVVDLDVVEE